MQTQLNIRIDDALKNQAEAVYGALGITVADAIRVFLSQSVIEHGFPFTPKAEKKRTVKDININEHIKRFIQQNEVALKLLADR